MSAPSPTHSCMTASQGQQRRPTPPISSSYAPHPIGNPHTYERIPKMHFPPKSPISVNQRNQRSNPCATDPHPTNTFTHLPPPNHYHSLARSPTPGSLHPNIPSRRPATARARINCAHDNGSGNTASKSASATASKSPRPGNSPINATPRPATTANAPAAS